MDPIKWGLEDATQVKIKEWFLKDFTIFNFTVQLDFLFN
jgi:hypothetical protein